MKLFLVLHEYGKRFWQISLLSVALVVIALANAAGKHEEDAEHGKAHNHEGAAAHENDHDEFIKLSDEQLKNADIGLAQVGPANIRQTLPLYGSVQLNGEQVTHMHARFPGVVRSVNKKMGEAVREGEALARVESNESLKTYEIVSGLKGVVVERNINPGEQTGDAVAFVVADLSSLWVELAVFPRDLAKVRVGQTVRIVNPAIALSAEGEVIAISVMANSSNQSATVRVLLKNPEGSWTPGLFVNADIVLATSTAPLSVRNEALQEHEGRQVVFVKTAQGFAPRAVKLGRVDGEFSEVLSGIDAGETYAARNSFIVKAESGKGEASHHD